jgi:hypothetical protein
MLNRTQSPPFVDGLYGKFVEYGIKYFFPTVRLEAVTTGAHPGKQQITENPDGSSLTLSWMGTQYVLDNGKPFSDSELNLLKSIGTVLDSRYRMIRDPALADQRFELFRGRLRIDMCRLTLTVVLMRAKCGLVRTGSRTSSKFCAPPR